MVSHLPKVSIINVFVILPKKFNDFCCVLHRRRILIVATKPTDGSPT